MYFTFRNGCIPLQKEKGEAPFFYYTRFLADVKRKGGVN